MSGFIQFNSGHNANLYLAQVATSKSKESIEQVSASIHKIKSSVDSGQIFGKGGTINEQILLETYKNLESIRVSKIQKLDPKTIDKLSVAEQMEIAEEIGFIKSALRDLMVIRDKVVHQSLPPTASSLESFKAEWDKNAMSHNSQANHLLMRRLIIDSQISNAQLYQFFADKKIRSTGGWFVRNGEPTPLALEFAQFRKMGVADFYAKYNTVPKSLSVKVAEVATPVLHPVPKSLTRENFSQHMQVMIDRHYGQPFPHRDEVVVTLNGKEKKWISLTNEEKYQALWEHSLPHNRPKLRKLSDFGGNEKAWENHLDNRLFRGGHKVDGTPRIFLPRDPKADHGSDHAVRVALFSSIFGHLYDKYHPDITLKPEDYLMVQMAGAFHDSGRQTEGVDIDEERSAQNVRAYLTEAGVDPASVEESAKAVREKNHPHLGAKHVIAKSVQCADSAEYARLFEAQSEQEFEASGNFLDIVKEFKSLPSLKGGKSFKDFKDELDGMRKEMNQFILETRNKRDELSEPGKNYYDELLKHVTSEKYPKLHAALIESGVLSSKSIPQPEAMSPVVSSGVIQEQIKSLSPDSLPKPVKELEESNQLFPGMLSEVSLVNEDIGGSTGAQLVADSEGNKFVKKTTGVKIQPDHLRSEYRTTKAYKALGVDVPEVVLYHSVTSKQVRGDTSTKDDQPVMLSKFIPGKTQKVGEFLKVPLKLNEQKSGVVIDDNWKKANAASLKQVQDVAKRSFVADCLLANWDVAGLIFDNMLIDVESHKIWRIDNGAGLDYRAQGGKKNPKLFTPVIQEFQSLRNPAINPNTALLYETLTEQDIIDQINDILPRREAFLATIPDHLQDIMSKRFDFLTAYGEKLAKEKRSRAA